MAVAAASATPPSSAPAISVTSSVGVLGEFLAQRLEDVGHGLEQILVEVVLAAFAAAKDEIAFEIRRFFDPFDQFFVMSFLSCHADE